MAMQSTSRYRAGTVVAAWILIVLSGSVFIGWLANITPLLTVLPGRITMKANTALGFLATALTILLLTRKNVTRRSQAAAAVLAMLVFAVGELTLLQYAVGINLRIDQLLFRDATQLQFPGRMAQITAVNFCMVGLSLSLMALSRRQALWPQLLSLLTGLSALLAIVGYLYGVPLLYGSTSYTSMALHTGVGFLIASAAILHIRPHSGLMAVISSDYAGGWLSRRVVPIAVLMPLVLGVIYIDTNFALKDSRLALACLTVCEMVFFLVVLWSFSLRLNQSEAERHVVNHALAQSESDYRTMFEEAVVGIFQSTPDNRLLRANPAMARIFGYQSGQEMIDAIHAIHTQVYVDPERRAEFNRLLKEEGSVKNFECQVYRKDGAKIWLGVNARAVIRDGVVERYDGTFEEITERKSLEDQLRQAQKMEAVGRLAGGIAHDFNNAVGVILGYSALLKERLGSDSTSRRYAEEVGRAGQHAAMLTRQLLAFSRKQVIKPVALNLNEVVGETERMLRRVIGEDVELVIDLSPDLANVCADPGQINQILMNLAVNARDAMPRGGRLLIQTGNAELDETNLSGHEFARPGQYVLLSVSDTGCGMDKETLAHIFEPFFTTKAAGHGTGLGLSTVYGIVKQNDGYVWVYSEVDKGTRFKVYLPRVMTPAQRLQHEEETVVPKGAETILLVEDDEAMRTLTRTCLESAGYTVFDADSGESAIAVMTRHQGPIHLLLTDVIMPGITGRQLAESLTAARAETKVLYMSGYTADIIAERGVLDAGIALLEKPFTREGLLKKVRAVLDGEPFAQSAAGSV